MLDIFRTAEAATLSWTNLCKIAHFEIWTCILCCPEEPATDAQDELAVSRALPVSAPSRGLRSPGSRLGV
jgi:hypothetical protein